jgi:hypothetical protein
LANLVGLFLVGSFISAANGTLVMEEIKPGLGNCERRKIERLGA